MPVELGNMGFYRLLDYPISPISPFQSVDGFLGIKPLKILGCGGDVGMP